MSNEIAKLTASQEDIDGVTKAAMDYLFGWVDGDAERHAEAYHAEALKRRFFTDEETGVDQLNWVTPQLMVDWVRSGSSVETNIDHQFIIDDITEGMASARLYSTKWIDFLHLVKARGEWRILNVTWKHTPDGYFDRPPEVS